MDNMLDLRGVFKRANFDYDTFKEVVTDMSRESGLLAVYNDHERGKLATLSVMLKLIPDDREILMISSHSSIIEKLFTEVHRDKRIVPVIVSDDAVMSDIVGEVRRIRSNKNSLVIVLETDNDNFAGAALTLAMKEKMTVWCSYNAPEPAIVVHRLKSAAMTTQLLHTKEAQDEIVKTIKLAISVSSDGDSIELSTFECPEHNVFKVVTTNSDNRKEETKTTITTEVQAKIDEVFGHCEKELPALANDVKIIAATIFMLACDVENTQDFESRLDVIQGRLKHLQYGVQLVREKYEKLKEE